MRKNHFLTRIAAAAMSALLVMTSVVPTLAETISYADTDMLDFFPEQSVPEIGMSRAFMGSSSDYDGWDDGYDPWYDPSTGSDYDPWGPATGSDYDPGQGGMIPRTYQITVDYGEPMYWMGQEDSSYYYIDSFMISWAETDMEAMAWASSSLNYVVEEGGVIGELPRPQGPVYMQGTNLKMLVEWELSDGTRILPQDIVNYMPAHDEIIRPVWQSNFYTITVHEGSSYYSFIEPQGAMMVRDENLMKSPHYGATSYNLYMGPTRDSQRLFEYLAANGGLQQDLDVYATWVQNIDLDRYNMDPSTIYYEDGSVAADVMVEIYGEYLMTDAAGHPLTSTWVGVEASELNGYKYGARTLYYYFDEDGYAIRDRICELPDISGTSYDTYLFDPYGVRMFGFVDEYYQLVDAASNNIYGYLSQIQYHCGRAADCEDSNVRLNALKSGFVNLVLPEPYDDVHGTNVKLFFDDDFRKVTNCMRTIGTTTYSFDDYGVATEANGEYMWYCLDGRYFYGILRNGMPAEHPSEVFVLRYDPDRDREVKCFVGRDGFAVCGTLIGVQGDYYFADRQGVIAENMWVAFDGDPIAESYGIMYRWRYFGDDGRALKNTKTRINGKLYRFGSDGQMLFGFVDSQKNILGVLNEDGSLSAPDIALYAAELYVLNPSMGDDMETPRDQYSSYEGWLKLRKEDITDPSYDMLPELWMYFRYGQKLTGIKTIDGTSYEFDSNGICMNPAGDMSSYTVKHYLQDPDDPTQYIAESALTETLNGTAGSMTNAGAQTPYGFEPPIVVQQQIAADGSTVVEIFYNRRTYTINFNMNGHGTQIEPLTTYYGAALAAPVEPQEDNCVFSGWYRDAACTTPYSFTTMPINGITVFAKWEEMFHWVTVNGNEYYGILDADGSLKDCLKEVWRDKVNPENGQITHHYLGSDGAMVKQSLLPLDDGIYFVGRSGERVSRTWLRFDAPVEAQEQFGIQYYWYFFDENGRAYRDRVYKTISGNPYGFDSEGRERFGFYDASGNMCGWRIGSKTYSMSGDSVLDAVRYYAPEPNSDSSFVMHKGWLEIDKADLNTHDYDSLSEIRMWFHPEDGHKAADCGYIIDGVQYYFDANGICTNPNAASTPYVVKYLLQDPNRPEEYNEAISFRETRAGAVGSMTNAQIKQIGGFVTPASVTQQPIAADGSTVIEIYYERERYTINLHMNGHGPELAPIEARFGQRVTAPAPTDPNYEFLGWFADADLTTDYTFSIMPNGGADVYAKWEAKSYSITYNLDGGMIFDSYQQKHVYDTATQLPADVRKSGYIFGGWYTTADFTDTQVTVIPAADVNPAGYQFYAKWIEMEAQPVAITLDAGIPTDVHAIAEELIANQFVQKSPEGLVEAIDQDDLKTALADNNVDLQNATEIRVGVDITLKEITSEALADGTAANTIVFEAEPYAEAYNGSAAIAGSKTVVENNMLNRGAITLTLPIPASVTGSIVKIVHRFRNGGSETILCRIKENNGDRYVEFKVDQFSPFELSFTDSFYEIGEIAEVPYTGKPIRPRVKLMDGDDVVTASEYGVTYDGDLVNVGTATVRVSMKKTGEVLEKSFTIKKGTPEIRMANVSVSYDGKAHGASASAQLPNGISVPVASVHYYTDPLCTKNETAEAPTKAGTYYAKAIVAETENYQAAEKTAIVTILSVNSGISGGSGSGGSGGGGGIGHGYMPRNSVGFEMKQIHAGNGAVQGHWNRNKADGTWSFVYNGSNAKGCWMKIALPNVGADVSAWFYFDANGIMLTGWQKIPTADGKLRWYYLNPTEGPIQGACFLNTTTPDGYTVNENGEWTLNGSVQLAK